MPWRNRKLGDNTAMVESVVALAGEDTPEERARFYSLVTRGSLLVAGSADGLVIGAQVTEQGDTWLPAFTSAETFAAWNTKGAEPMVVSGASLFESVLDTPVQTIVLDAGAETGAIITRLEIEDLARGRFPTGAGTATLAAGSSYKMGLPATPPSAALLAVLQTAGLADPAIEAVYVFLMQQDNAVPELVAAVCVAESLSAPDVDLVIRALIDRVHAASGDAHDLAFIRADAELRDALAGGEGIAAFMR